MPKVDFTILKKKKMGLPVWAWALILALGLYLVYRHSKNTAGATAASAPDTSAALTNAGDLMSSGSTNAGNTQNPLGNADLGDNGLQNNIDAVKGQVQDLSDALGVDAANLAGSHDAAQNQDTTANDGTDSNSAALGLTHIAGDYWWDPDTHRLIKIPGSGGQKTGTGKKKVPNTTKAGGKRKKIKAKAPVKKRLHPKQPKFIKPRIMPKPAPHQVPLTAAQRRAIDAHHHPAPKPPPKKKTAVHKTIRPPVRHGHPQQTR